MLLDERFDRRLVEVADGDHRHQLRPVPVGVELLQPLVLEVLDHLHVADRQPLGVARSLEQHRKLLVLHPRAGAAAQPPLLDDDAALLVDLGGIERHVVRPVLEDQERLIEDVGLVGRHLEHVDRLVEARERVDARAEPHADRLEERHRLLLREVLACR